MTRMVDADDLVTHGEVAWRLHVNPSTVSNYLTRHTDFPKPAFVSGKHVKLFLWSEVREWCRQRDMPIVKEFA